MSDEVFSFRSPGISGVGPEVRSVRERPFSLHGLYRPETPGPFRRLPEEVASQTGKKILLLSTNTAGARVRFRTDSSFIALGALFDGASLPSVRTAAFLGAGAYCFDLYADGRHVRLLWPEAYRQSGPLAACDLSDGRLEAFHDFGSAVPREITICFPPYANLREVWIGLDRDADISEASPYLPGDPVVFYGSSITQGACASRPGNAYPAVLSRRLGFDYVNLGFASGARAQKPVIDYLCSIPMSVLVFDYDHNAPSPEFLEETHGPALRRLREAHPDVPMVVLSRPDIDGGLEGALRRIAVIEESCESVRRMGPAQVVFVNGYDIYRSLDPEMMILDGTHPTDLGHYAIAAALTGPLREILSARVKQES